MVRTDHKALSYLPNFKYPQGQNSRWLQVFDTYIEYHLGKEAKNADAWSQGPCKQCLDGECCACEPTRGQARKEVQLPMTEEGGDWNLVVDVKKKTEEVIKKSARGRIAATEDGNQVNLGPFHFPFSGLEVGLDIRRMTGLGLFSTSC